MRDLTICTVVTCFLFVTGCVPENDQAGAPEDLTEMTGRKLMLELGDAHIPLHVDSPAGLDPMDDYREVTFGLPGKGRRRAVFFLLPDTKSHDPHAAKPVDEWDAPVRWDDNTMLFVPSLSDDSILAAMRYILGNGLEDEAFEDEDDIRLNDR